ncbi:hypothetical protein ACFLRC_02605 [Candidatus Altiarchaeota archaeon]
MSLKSQEAGFFSALFEHVGSVIVFGILGFFLCRFCIASIYPHFAWMQKSLLESSPFLLSAIPGFKILLAEGKISRGWWYVLGAQFIYVGIVLWGKTNSFGGLVFSSSYLIPVIPSLIVVGSGHLNKFLRWWFPCVLLVFSILFYFLPVYVNDPMFYAIPQTGFVLVVFLAVMGIRRIIERDDSPDFNLSVLFALALIVGTFANINDAKIVNEFRQGTIWLADEVLTRTEEESVVFIPLSQTLLYDSAELHNREVFWYGRSYEERSIGPQWMGKDPEDEVMRVVEFYLNDNIPVYFIVTSDVEAPERLSQKYVLGEGYNISTKYNQFLLKELHHQSG